MSYIPKTRAEIKEQARQNYEYKKAYQAYKNAVKQQEAQKVTAEKQRQENANKGFLQRAWETVADIGGNIASGAVKFGEGIVDAGSSIVGNVAGILGNKELADQMAKNVAYDWTGENVKKPIDKYTSGSFINDTIIDDITQGIGQMLPVVALNLIPGVGLGALGVSAFGGGTEHGLNEGQTLGDASKYGLLSAGVEVATESLGGLVGKGGALTKVAKDVGQTGLGRVARNAVEEGIEEIISETVNPLVKNITYSDRSLGQDFLTKEHLGDIAKSGVVGAAVGGLLGGGQYILNKTSTDVGTQIENLNELKKIKDELWQKSELTQEKSLEISNLENEALNKVSNSLINTNEEKRLNLLKQIPQDISSRFNSDGTIKTIDDATGSNIAQVAQNFNPQAYSPNITTNELNSAIYKPTMKELNDNQKQSVKLASSVLDTGVKVIFSDSMPESVNGTYKNGIMTINVNSSNPAETIIKHELSHHLEKTQTYKLFERFLTVNLSDNPTLKAKFGDIDAKFNEMLELYRKNGVFKNYTEKQLRQEAAHDVIADFVGENLFTDQSTIELLAKKDRNLFKKIYDWIKSVINKLKQKITLSKDERAVLSFLENAEKLYAGAVNESRIDVMQSDRLSANDNNKTVVDKFSLFDYKGTNYVLINTAQDIFDGVSEGDYSKVAKKYILQHFRGKQFPLSNSEQVAITTKSANKITYSNVDKASQSIKNRISTELDNLLKASKFIRRAQDTKKHSFAKQGFEYWGVNFLISNKAFYGVLNIALNNDAKMLYDINPIHKKSEVFSQQLSSVANADALRKNASHLAQSKNSAHWDTSTYNSILQQEKNIVNKNADEDKNVRYSLDKSFDEQVDDVLAGNFNKYNAVKVLDKTPKILQDVGLPNLPMLITATHIESAVMESGSKNINYHGLGIDAIRKLNNEIKNPVMILQSLTRPDESIVLLTRLVDKNNQPVIVPIIVSGSGMFNYIQIDANIIASVYGRKNFSEFIENNLDKGTVLFYDKKMSQELFKAQGIQFPNRLENLNSNIIIRKFSNNATEKEKYSLASEKDSEGKQLTKEQQEFFKDSKIRVIKEGSPFGKIDSKGQLFPVYHGTNSNEFFEFDKNLTGTANDRGWYGSGFYFAFSKGEAGYYGKNVIEAYLNITKPFIFDKQLQEYDGVHDGDIDFDFGAFVLNLSEKFPNLAEQLKTNVILEWATDSKPAIRKNINFNELAKDIKKIYNSNRLQIVKSSDGDKIYYNYALKDNLDDFDFDSKTKEFIRKNSTYNSWNAEYSLERNRITQQDYDKLMDLFEKFDDKFEQPKYSRFKYETKEIAEKARLSIAVDFVDDGIYKSIDKHMPEYYMEIIGDKFKSELIKQGYDGVIQTEYGDEVVAFNANQIKLTTNKNPTLNEDIRYSLSKGQMEKYIANRIQEKVFTKADAEKIISGVIGDNLGLENKYGILVGESRQEAINKLWSYLNNSKKGYDANVAFDIADYIIENTFLDDVFKNYNNTDSVETIKTLKQFFHKFNLDSIKEEVKHKFDKKAPSIYALWQAKSGGRGADVIAQELQEMGFSFNSSNEADLFFEILDYYQKAVNELKKRNKVELDVFLSIDEKEALRNNIVREIMNGYDTEGKETQFAKTIKKYTNQIEHLRSKVKEVKNTDTAIMSIIADANRAKKLKEIDTTSANIRLPEEIKTLVNKISKLATYKNNLKKTFYNELNDFFKEYTRRVGDKHFYDIVSHDEISEQLVDDINNLNGKTEFAIEDLRALDRVLTQFINDVRNYDKIFFEGRRQSEFDLANQGVDETETALKIKGFGDVKKLKILDQLLNPGDRFAALALHDKNSVLMRIYKELRKGDKRRAQFVKDASDHFEDFQKKNKNYWNDLHKEVNFGDIKITKGQALSLYLTAQREQGRKHLFDANSKGIVKFTNEEYAKTGDTRKAFVYGKQFDISTELVNQIETSLTEIDKEFLGLQREFYNTISKNTLNEVYEKMYGKTLANEDNYFPIKVSDDKLYKEVGNASINEGMTSITAKSFTKAINVNAKEMLVIEDIMDVTARHLREMSIYVGYAEPISAYNRIINRQTENGNMLSKIKQLDNDFQNYVNKLLLDVQGINLSDKGLMDKTLSAVRMAGAMSALALNPKVLLTQTVSLPAAIGGGLKMRYIPKSIFGKKNIETLIKYSPLMWERFDTGNNVEVAELKAKEFGGKNKLLKGWGKVWDGLQSLLKPITWTDKQVIGVIWQAAQNQIQDEKGFKIGTEDNYKAAAEFVEDIVFKTQQSSDPLARSGIMRSNNEMTKFVRMFHGDAFQTTSRLYTAINKYKTAKSLLKSGDGELVKRGQELLKEAKTEARQVAAALTLSVAMMVAIAEFFKWFKHKDDDETYEETAVNELMSYFAGLVPLGSEVLSLFNGYEPTNMAYTGLTNIANAFYEAGEALLTLNDAKDPIKQRAKVRKIALGLSQTFGIPLRNFETYLFAVIGTVSPVTKIQWDSLFYTKTNKEYLGKIETAVKNGDERTASALINMFINQKSGISTSEEVSKKLVSLFESGFSVEPKTVSTTISINGESVNLTSQQYKALRETYAKADSKVGDLIKDNNFNSLSAENQAEAIQRVYDYYYYLGIKTNFENYENKLASIGKLVDISQLSIAISLASTISGNTRKAQIQKIVSKLNLTAVQKYIVMGYLGYKNANGESSAKSYLKSKGLSGDSLEQIMKWAGY